MRRLLRGYGTRFEAELVEIQLKEVGIPVTVMTDYRAGLGENSRSELWIDSELLENEPTRMRIELAMMDHPIELDAEAIIESLPTAEQEAKKDGLLAVSFAILCAIFVVAVGLVARFMALGQ